MKYTGPIYRPPIEANTVLLQVTVGCAHNKCTFCTMYKNTGFCIESMEQIEIDLQEAKAAYGSLKRIFWVNGDAFVLSARRLKEISNKITEYFPMIEVITMYASIRNIMSKTDDELKELKTCRINDLWIGLETGNEQSLKRFNKGFTLNDSYEQLERLNKAGIRHNSIFMLGTGGSGKAEQNAYHAAKLINAAKPSIIGVTPLGFFEGSQLSEEVSKGYFTPATEIEILLEEKKLIELINTENIPF